VELVINLDKGRVLAIDKAQDVIKNILEEVATFLIWIG